MTTGVAARLLPVAAVAVLTGCANTVDTSVAPPASAAAPATTFVATGSTTELLDQLLAEATALSEAVIDGEGETAIIARIDTIWATVRVDIEESVTARRLRQFDDAIAMLRTAVERRRPADADKGVVNLRTLIDADG